MVQTITQSLKPLEWLSLKLELPPAYRRHTFSLSSIGQITIAMMLNILSLAVPVMMLQIYDRIIPHKAYSTLAMLSVGVVIALAVDATLRMMRAHLTSWTAATHEHAAGCAAMERLVNADLPQFDAHNTGTYLQQFAAISKLRDFYSGQSLTAIVDLPFAAVFLVLIAYLGGWLVYIPLTLLALFAVFAHYAGTKLKHSLETRSAGDDRKASYLISVLSGIHTAKSMGMEMPLVRRFEAAQSHVTKGSYHVAMASGFATLLSALFGQLSLILTAGAGSILVIQGIISVGALSACTLLAGRALQPIQRVLGAWLRLQDISVAYAQANELLNMPMQPRHILPLQVPEGIVQLQNLSFGYDATPLFENISLRVEPGDVIAISGDKNSGKSTLLQLIAGVLTPTAGLVQIDGLEPATYSLSELAQHIGYLPQQGAIFKGTILENLTGFHNDDAAVAAAKRAAQQLGLDTIINLLPNGYATKLTGSAVDPLPPGVKQRLALARILRHTPAIILFDDADRALDKDGYNLLFRMMGQLKGRATIIMVSHDQNLLSFADRFYALHPTGLHETAPPEMQHLSLLVKQPLRGDAA